MRPCIGRTAVLVSAGCLFWAFPVATGGALPVHTPADALAGLGPQTVPNLDLSVGDLTGGHLRVGHLAPGYGATEGYLQWQVDAPAVPTGNTVPTAALTLTFPFAMSLLPQNTIVAADTAGGVPAIQDCLTTAPPTVAGAQGIAAESLVITCDVAANRATTYYTSLTAAPSVPVGATGDITLTIAPPAGVTDPNPVDNTVTIPVTVAPPRCWSIR